MPIICLNRDYCSDLQWWHLFGEGWNGVAILSPSPSQLTLTFTSDASGNWVCGAWSQSRYGGMIRWFQLAWDATSCTFPIAAKEMTPVIIAVVVWGSECSGRMISCRCDNQVVVAILHSHVSEDTHLVHMLRCLFFIEAHYQFYISASYISMHDNVLADDLSHTCLSSFFAKVPQTDTQPTPVPPLLLSLLFNPDMDWVLPTWTSQFQDIFTTV